jgi:hypothetical protein
MVSTVQNSTGNASCAVDFGSNIVWTSGWNMFMWKIWLAPSTIGTRAAGGLVFIIGSDVNNFREWNTAGSDYILMVDGRTLLLTQSSTKYYHRCTWYCI